MRLIFTVIVLSIIVHCNAHASTLPADFRDAITIVPLDSKSLVATIKPFTVPTRTSGPVTYSSFADILKWYCVFGIPYSLKPNSENEAVKVLSFLEGKEVVWALAAKRDQEIKMEPGSRIVKLGMHPYESIAIAHFVSPIASEFIERNEPSLEKRTLGNGMIAYMLRQKERRLAFLFPRPDMFIAVSTLSESNAMLEDVATRIQSKPTNRLFEAADDVWAVTDIESSFWGIRKIKQGPGRSKEDEGRSWVTFSFNEDRPTVFGFGSVLSKTGSSEKPNPWLEKNVKQEQREQVLKDMGVTIRMSFTDDVTNMKVECLPSITVSECVEPLTFIFYGQVLGAMIFI